MTPKEKIIKYLKIKKISQDKFSRTCNVASGFLRQGKSFNIELVKKIRDNYPDLNLNNILFDEGDLIKNTTKTTFYGVNEESAIYNSSYKKELIELQNKHIKLHEAFVESLEEIKRLNLKNNNL